MVDEINRIKNMYTKKQAVQYLQEQGRDITLSGINYNIKAGHLTPVKVLGRVMFSQAELDEFLSRDHRARAWDDVEGGEYISPAMYYKQGLSPDNTAVYNDGKRVVNVQPTGDTRQYELTYEDATTEVVYCQKALTLHHLVA